MNDNKDLLEEIREQDAKSTNGGHHVESKRRYEAEELVEQGKVVRMINPAGVTPIYVPMDSNHYSRERLERLRDRQRSDENVK